MILLIHNVLIVQDNDHPTLPALQCLTLVCGNVRNPNAHLDIGSRYHHDAYLIPQLTRIFAHYPTLEQIEWVNGYPTNPLQDEQPPSWPEQDVLRRVRRVVSDVTDTIHLIDSSSLLTSARTTQ